jgi:hypothetical protein
VLVTLLLVIVTSTKLKGVEPYKPFQMLPHQVEINLYRDKLI